MRILIHADEYYPTAQACAYRMQVFVDTFMAMGDEVTVVTSSANKANGTIDKRLHKEKIIYSPAIRMKKKTTVMRMLNNLTFGITSIFSAISAGKVNVVTLGGYLGYMTYQIANNKIPSEFTNYMPGLALITGLIGCVIASGNTQVYETQFDFQISQTNHFGKW